jgi:hypothetical protein
MVGAHGQHINYALIKTIFAVIAKERKLRVPIARMQFEGDTRNSAVASFERAITQSSVPQMTFESAWAQMMEFVGRLEE